MLSNEDRFFIRGVHNGKAPDLEGAPESVARIATFLKERGCPEDSAEDRASFLLWRVSVLREDLAADRWAEASSVRKDAASLILQLDVVDHDLDPNAENNRLFAALAKALVVDDPQADLLVMAGRDRQRLRDLLGALETLRSGLNRVVVAHTQPAGRPPKEMEAEALAELANHYIAATGRRLTLTSDPVSGTIKGDFCDFARLVCDEAGTRHFSEQDLKNLRGKLRDSLKSRQGD